MMPCEFQKFVDVDFDFVERQRLQLHALGGYAIALALQALGLPVHCAVVTQRRECAASEMTARLV